MMQMTAIFLLPLVMAAAAFFVSTNKRLALLVVLAMFISRPALDIGGLSVRIELLVGCLAFVRLVHESLARRLKPLTPAVRWSSWFILVWLCFAAVTSLNVPPVPQRSMSVLIWCFLNFITALWIAMTPASWFWILRWGSIVGLVSCVSATFFWIAATGGVFVFGVQVDPTYGGYAAYGFSIEANILAGLLCLWALVAVANPMSAVPRWVRFGLAFTAPVAILATHTRAALVSYVVGLLACLVWRAAARKVAAVSLCFGGLAAISLLISSSDVGLSKFAGVFDIGGGTGGLRYRVNSLAFEEWWSSSERWIGLGWNSFGQRHFDDTQPGLLLPGYIGNLVLQIGYDAGLFGLLWVALAAGIVVTALTRLGRFDLIVIFLVPYMMFSIATSSLWLLETWAFVGLAWGLCYQAKQASSAANEMRRSPVHGRTSKEQVVKGAR